MRRSLASGLVGSIEIPRLGVSGIIAEGSDAATLRRAVGHLPGTAFPGEVGNAVLAAHRDSLFRGLREVQPDDRIRLITPDRGFGYLVESSAVVPPTRTEVPASSDDATLTLITCHPFAYVGPAPSRIVVRARLERVER